MWGGAGDQYSYLFFLLWKEMCFSRTHCWWVNILGKSFPVPLPRIVKGGWRVTSGRSKSDTHVDSLSMCAAPEEGDSERAAERITPFRNGALHIRETVFSFRSTLCLTRAGLVLISSVEVICMQLKIFLHYEPFIKPSRYLNIVFILMEVLSTRIWPKALGLHHFILS